MRIVSKLSRPGHSPLDKDRRLDDGNLAMLPPEARRNLNCVLGWTDSDGEPQVFALTPPHDRMVLKLALDLHNLAGSQ